MQLEILGQRIQDKCPDTLILCEHPAVFTSGRLGREENILAGKEALEKADLEVLRVNRGGDITFHGPGQLVVYPIFDLTSHKKDLKYFLSKLEETAIKFLRDFGCSAFSKSGFTGVWVGNKKIASLGIAVKKWVSFHGLAININTNLAYFSLIKPCGLDVEMTSLSDILKYKINMEQAKKALVDKFISVFGLELTSFIEGVKY